MPRLSWTCRTLVSFGWEIGRKLVTSVLAVDDEVVFFGSGILDHERGLAWFQTRRHVDLVVRQRDVNAPRIWIGSDGTDDFVNDFFGAFDYFVSDIFGGVDRVRGHLACLFDWALRPDHANGQSDHDDG